MCFYVYRSCYSSYSSLLMISSVNGLDISDSLTLAPAEESFNTDMTSIAASLAETRVT